MTPRRLRVLYVTDRFDGPYRFRCKHACEQLRADGATANVARVDDPRLPELVGRYGVVVLFRLPYGERVEKVVAAARAARVPLVFDIDDLTFDASFSELMPFRKRYTAEKWAAAYGHQMVNLRKTLDVCDAFIGSTPELAEQARRLGKTAYVHPNVVPDLYLELGKWLLPFRRNLVDRPTIGYFSGSDTHDEDFASIGRALEQVLAIEPEAQLLVVGHLDLGRRRTSLEHRVIRLPYMHWKDFAAAYAACHVTLAPLSVRNAFTDSKSALKFFEAGAFFTPVVATPVREMSSAIVHGETGYLAETTGDWISALLACLDPTTSERVGRAAREAVVRRHSTGAQAGKLLGLLDGLSVTPRGKRPRASLLDPPNELGRGSILERALRPASAARDVIRILSSVRRELPPSIDVARAERIVDRVTTDDAARRALVRAGGAVFSNDDLSGWHANDQVTMGGELPGELYSDGSDPNLTSARVSLAPGRIRYLAVRMRVVEGPPTRCQIYFKSGDTSIFRERASVSFPVSGDGIDATYVVDLENVAGGAEFRALDSVTHLRLDPVDREGSFRVSALVWLPPPEAVENEPLFASTSPAAGRISEWPAADDLAREIAELDRTDRRRYRLRESTTAARRVLDDALRGLPVVVDRLEDGDGETLVTLARAAEATTNGVDVVVPVFNARPLVLRCVESVVRHARGDYRLVIVDDASTDPELHPALEDFARSRPEVVLLRNPENLGFLGTANRGMRHAGGRDVLLLNSDTEVFEGFLERLRRAAYSHRRAGLVSPLSNNATICSVPEFCRKNELPEGLTAADVADIVARSSRKLRPELVTPHGFCLYLRADFLAEVGVFDEAHYGRGFGEENDLGERAKGASYRILLADDVYVWHEGKASFGDEGHALENEHAKVLEERHPGYHAAVAQFVRQNPLAPVQATVRRHLARGSHRIEPAPLVVLHASPFGDAPGGVEHCVRDLVRSMALPRVVLAYPAGGDLEVAEVTGGDLYRPLLYRFRLGHPPERFSHEHGEAIQAFAEVFDLFHVGMVHVHHLMFLPLDFARLLLRSDLPYVVTVHDFYPSCPSFNLLNLRTMQPCCPGTCGDREKTEECQRALHGQLGHPLPPDPVGFVEAHRRRYAELFAGARRILFPSASTLGLTGAMLKLPAERCEVLPHGYDAPEVPERRPEPGAPLRIALIGQIAYPSKGSEAYLRVIEKTSGARVEWHLFGRTDLFDFETRLSKLDGEPKVVRHGPYHRDTIVTKLVEAGIELAVLLPSWPETFSYTLSEMLAAGVPVIARRIGALADRLTGAPYAKLVENADEAADAVLALVADRIALAAMAEEVPAIADTSAWAARHHELYAECRAASPVNEPRAASVGECFRLNQLGSENRPPDPVLAITSPASEYVNTWWFPYADRMKPYVPESLRQFARHRLARENATPLATFRLPGQTARLGAQLFMKRRYVATTLLVSEGADPYITIDLPALDPRAVELLRFNMWCSTPHAAFAQLYWRHKNQRDFDEEHSLIVPLNGSLAAWQEYVVRLEASDRAKAWYEGGDIVSLRFDPINLPGLIGVGELALCAIGSP